MIIRLMWFCFQFSVSFECRLANDFLFTISQQVGGCILIMIIKKRYMIIWSFCGAFFAHRYSLSPEIPMDMTITLLNRFNSYLYVNYYFTIQTFFERTNNRIAYGFVALTLLRNESVFFPKLETNNILMTATIIIVTEKTIPNDSKPQRKII